MPVPIPVITTDLVSLPFFVTKKPLSSAMESTGGRTAERLIAKVKPGGVYASVVGVSQNARSTHL